MQTEIINGTKVGDPLLINQVSGYFVVAEVKMADEVKRIYGFFSSNTEMNTFTQEAHKSGIRVIAVKKTTQTYRDGEGLNYA